MRILITGGCGFIGSHAVRYFANRGDQVHALDNLSRAGSDRNQRALQQLESVTLHEADIRDTASLRRMFCEYGPYDVVLHLAGQVAVTASVQHPLDDFTANALGTLHLLEAVRTQSPQSIFLYSSTNKVYGAMADVEVIESGDRFVYANYPHGIGEGRRLDFLSPYGCSKGAADQYVLDYARIYGLKTVVFRQSCIYGTHQYGIEDQGWVAWFCIAALRGKPVTVYGNGKQVRDVLYIDDLIGAYAAALERIGKVAGMVFNIGGGATKTLSLLELIDLLKRRLGKSIPVSFADWRPGDQRVCIMDIRKAHQLLHWAPQTDVAEGIDRLLDWVRREY